MKRIINQVNRLMPRSNAVSTCWPARLLATFPKYVCAPVAMMTPVAEPLSTLVPRKQMFECSMDETFARESRASVFSTGSDSPVSVAWMMNRSLAESRRTSPGIMSPADNFTTSPGTSWCRGISFAWPSRRTVAVTLIIALSLAAALSAFVSWMKRSDTPSTTIASITTPPMSSLDDSAVAKVRMARIISRITSGLRTATQSRHSQSCCFSWATSLGPNTSNRSAASSSVKPVDEVLSRWRISAVSCVAASRTRSAVRWPLEFVATGINIIF